MAQEQGYRDVRSHNMSADRKKRRHNAMKQKKKQRKSEESLEQQWPTMQEGTVPIWPRSSIFTPKCSTFLPGKGSMRTCNHKIQPIDPQNFDNLQIPWQWKNTPNLFLLLQPGKGLELKIPKTAHSNVHVAKVWGWKSGNSIWFQKWQILKNFWQKKATMMTRIVSEEELTSPATLSWPRNKGTITTCPFSFFTDACTNKTTILCLYT